MIMIIKGSRFVCMCVYVPYKYKYDGDSTSDESLKNIIIIIIYNNINTRIFIIYMNDKCKYSFI